MRPLCVVVRGIPAKHSVEVLLSEDQHAVGGPTRAPTADRPSTTPSPPSSNAWIVVRGPRSVTLTPRTRLVPHPDKSSTTGRRRPPASVDAAAAAAAHGGRRAQRVCRRPATPSASWPGFLCDHPGAGVGGAERAMRGRRTHRGARSRLPWPRSPRRPRLRCRQAQGAACLCHRHGGIGIGGHPVDQQVACGGACAVGLGLQLPAFSLAHTRVVEVPSSRPSM